MAVVPGTSLTINDTTPQRIDVDESDYNPNSSAGEQRYGRVCSFKVDAAFHLGGNSTVRNAAGIGTVRGALFDGGFYSWPLSGTDQLYLIAPSGQTIHVERATTGA
jgi:hypothetical protein